MTDPKIEKEVLTVTVFERITQSPEVLGKFLACLPIIEGPWDDQFHEQFCVGCAAENCDKCPHEAQRNNPGWWLTLEVDTPAAGVCRGGCPLSYIDPAEHCDGCWRSAKTEGAGPREK